MWQNDRVEIIANDQGNRTTPSYVGFTDSERLIGDAAKNQVAMNPVNTVRDSCFAPMRALCFPPFVASCHIGQALHPSGHERIDAHSSAAYNPLVHREHDGLTRCVLCALGWLQLALLASVPNSRPHHNLPDSHGPRCRSSTPSA